MAISRAGAFGRRRRNPSRIIGHSEIGAHTAGSRYFMSTAVANQLATLSISSQSANPTRAALYESHVTRPERGPTLSSWGNLFFHCSYPQNGRDLRAVPSAQQRCSSSTSEDRLPEPHGAGHHRSPTKLLHRFGDRRGQA